MTSESPKTLGPYRLVESIGRGDMAEVFRARRDGPGGFVKDLALKQILPQYAKNSQLVQRFMEEARIAGALIHGNIVQVYDFGFVGGQYYIAMEYIDGMSLAAMLDLCVEAGIPLPSPLVAYIGAEVCSGLEYAHNLTDESGVRVGVVHRDVSPQNIMLSFAGDVKLGDFGIVKAADSLVRTEAGLRLGKISYMSPEQAAGEPLDGRSDLFALGVTLWEALTLRPLLPRHDAPATIELLAKCDFPPPSKYRRDVPRALEELLLRSLAHRREDRFSDGAAMARGLRAFYHAVAPGFGRHDLVEYLAWLRPGEGRISGVGPPAPPPGMSTLRGGGTVVEKRRRALAWIALAAAPILGLTCGATSFLALSLLPGQEPVEPIPQVIVAPPPPHPPPPPAISPQVLPTVPGGALPAELTPAPSPGLSPAQGAIIGSPEQNQPETPPPAVEPPADPRQGGPRRRGSTAPRADRSRSREGKPEKALSPNRERQRLPDPF